ncbi:MAG TPA: FliA/WhiG family RNA polymerase sigma factor [Planctomycetes bacterium]|nr:FliA/WhiG family RNA polymerase sigma factor [Planctomycetota bacterium]
MVQVAVKSTRAKNKAESEKLDILWKTYKRTGDPNLRNVLIEHYYPLVRYISERLLATLPKSIDLEDLVSAGLFGLMDAIDGFDLSRGIKFKTYCTTRIRGSILDELRSQDWVPRLVRLKANKINKAYRALESRFGREPTDMEMCREIDCTLSEYHRMVEDAQPVTIYSLSDKWDENNDDHSLEKSEILADVKSESPVESLNQRDVIEAVTRNLSQKEKRIVIMYYYEGLTMKEIGRVLDLTESRVCQIHTNVLQRLKEQLQKNRQSLMA